MMVKHIPLTKGKVAIVSDIDADLAQYSWYTQTITSRLDYAVRLSHKDETGKWQRARLHREVIERVIGRPLQRREHVDHIDNNGLNNTRDNLRLVTTSQNGANRRLRNDSTSGYKGVSWRKQSQKWSACIVFNRKKIHLGLFENKHEAARAYNVKAIELQGQYARINVIDESL